MKNYSALLLLLVSTLIFSQNTLKLDSLKTPIKANIEEVSWISGHWEGTAFGGVTEEVWTSPLGGSMMGSFKLVVNNEVNFHELMTISEEDETLLLRIKHFSRDLKGWEEKDESEEFKLVKIEPNRVYFNNLTFEKISPSELNIYVVFKDESGNEEEVKFNYKSKIKNKHMKLAMISIPVNDVPKAFKFYTEILNFDEQLYMPEHYLAIVYKKDEVNGPAILLEPIDDEIYAPFQSKVYAKKLPVITFGTDNINEEYNRLLNLGVKFIKKPTQQDWGIEAIFDDTCGNFIQLIQKK
ncbi:MAG: hypothetical protein GQ540_08250 [Lutibacter sp.]|uniref:DUF6265 family protein n=1 Tax=Lutibacter sp. TaxID=1925666 RepID=UPI0019F922D9|nr:DUF6265 family protein [Lutibacter sp.]NOR28504.1 hypothetical protein [Lutibacter sp.]